MTAVLVLEDGRIFRGEPYGALGQGLGIIVTHSTSSEALPDRAGQVI